MIEINKYYDIFRRNFPYVSREDNTINEILNNKDNIIIDKRNKNNEINRRVSVKKDRSD